MLVSELREPAGQPKRPARVIFDLLYVIRLDRDTAAELEACHTSQSVLERVFFSSELNPQRGDLTDWTPCFRDPPETRLVAEKKLGGQARGERRMICRSELLPRLAETVTTPPKGFGQRETDELRSPSLFFVLRSTYRHAQRKL
jgi:hypothetical protein